MAEMSDMTTPITIFICYKKVLQRKEDGKIIERQNDKAEILSYLLKQISPNQPASDYNVWIDQSELGAGVAWETEIYKKIMSSDVLLVLVGPGTHESEWVKREIALANALGVAVVPIGSGLSTDELANELKGLGIEHIQGKITQNIRLSSDQGAALRNELRPDLLKAATRTKVQQDLMLNELLKQRSSGDPKAPDIQQAASFELKGADKKINVYVASGDISKVRGIDVLVNSENDYMQMARFFESRTVSSVLRRLGARIRDGKYEDTIQQELDQQLQLLYRGRPLQAGEVIATSCGGPNSKLATEIRARYILHVAAVQAVAAKGTVIPYSQPDQIEDCVRASLQEVVKINQANGVISPKDSAQRAEQERLAAQGRGQVSSIIFPIFGSGHGGSPVIDILPHMYSAMDDFFSDGGHPSSNLQSIYISAYTKKDADDLMQFLATKLGPPASSRLSA
jgi:O-acetyl-ADP-ribose deacetylase (regulator of RNase III)